MVKYFTLFIIWYIDGILPKGPYPPCLHMADRALLAGYHQYGLGYNESWPCLRDVTDWVIFLNTLYFCNYTSMCWCKKYVTPVRSNGVTSFLHSPIDILVKHNGGVYLAVSDTNTNIVIAMMYTILSHKRPYYNKAWQGIMRKYIMFGNNAEVIKVFCIFCVKMIISWKVFLFEFPYSVLYEGCQLVKCS